MEFVILFVQIFARTTVFLLILHVVLSMFMASDRPLRLGIARSVDPILSPFRRFIKPLNGIDFTPVIAIVAINLIEILLTRLLAQLI